MSFGFGLTLPQVLSQDATAHERSYGTPVDTVAEMRALVAADRADNQWRALNDKDSFYEFEPASVTADDGDEFLKPDDVVGAGRWEKRTGGAMAPVASVFGRLGAVVAAASDYNASQVDNDSGVVGVFVDDALDTLDAGKVNRAGDQELTGNWDTGAFTITTLGIQARAATSLAINSQDGTAAFTISDGLTVVNQNGRPSGDNSIDWGADGQAFAKVRTLTLQPSTGNALIIREAAGAEQMRFLSGGGIRVNGDRAFAFGPADDAVMMWDTFQTNPHFTLGVDSTTNLFIITDQDRIGTLDLGIGAKSNPHLVLHDGSLTPTNHSFLTQIGASFIIENRVAAGEVRIVGGTGGVKLEHDGTVKLRINSSGVGLMGSTPTAAGVTIAQIAGSEPINNTTGLDSFKLGWESRLWAGSAVTRTGWIRTEDVSGTDDQLQFVFSSDDNGGSENDFLLLRRSAAGNVAIRPASSESMLLQREDGTTILTFASSTTTVTDTFTWADNKRVELGTGGDYGWEYETANQTNNTLLWGTQGAEGNTVVLTDKARLTLDHAVGTPATPTFRFHDGSVTAGNFGSIAHTGTFFDITTNAGNMRFIAADAASKMEIRTTTILVRASIAPASNGNLDVGNDVDGFGRGFFEQIQASRTFSLTLEDEAAGVGLTLNAAGIVINEGGVDKDFRVESSGVASMLTVDGGLNRVGIGIGGAGQLGKLHIDQPSLTGAIPVLHLDQADLSEEFIEFAAAIGVGNPIEAVAAKALTHTHFIRIDVVGVGHLYFGAGTIA